MDHNDAVVNSQIHDYTGIEGLKNVIEECELFLLTGIHGRLYVHNGYFSLVPGLVYDPDKKADYLNFATDILSEKECVIFSNSVDSNNIYIIGALEKDIFQLFEDKLPVAKISHGSTIGLSYLLVNKYEFIGQEVFIILDNGHVYLSAFASHELQVFNRFEVDSEEDLLKYLFILFKQINFSQEYCKVNILGDLKLVNSRKENLELYFRNIIVVDPSSNINYLPGAERIKDTKNLDTHWTI
ncbi:hypothetical protein EL17_03410 [Anditalea andensis]|uniref:DUF3822 domain-containing protein n=2 Tax=Anditalea andensis TaxID=1048983 RepID=A0A074L4F6_9BACT|nr:hypothetical protein EL17_03410 [Anditalea andensis]